MSRQRDDEVRMKGSKMWLGIALAASVGMLLASPTIWAGARDEARVHYKVALVALNNNDFTTAVQELQQAAELDPSNTLIYFNLALVQSKTGHAKDGIENLRRAQELGLPADKKEAAEDLMATLTYELGQPARDTAKLVGTWQTGDHNGDEMFDHEHTCTWTFHSSVGDSGGIPDVFGELTKKTVMHSHYTAIGGHRVNDTDQWTRRWEAQVLPADETGKWNVTFRFIGCEGYGCPSKGEQRKKPQYATGATSSGTLVVVGGDSFSATGTGACDAKDNIDRAAPYHRVRQ